MAGFRLCPGITGQFRRRSHEGIGPPSTKPILKRQSRDSSLRLDSIDDSGSSGEGWFCAGSYPELCPKNRTLESYRPRQISYRAPGRIIRCQESVTYEESIPVIVRRRGCTMTVRIVSVDDIEVDDDDDEDVEELRVGPLSRAPRTPLLSRGSLPSTLGTSTRSSTPSPRCSLSVRSLPQVRT